MMKKLLFTLLLMTTGLFFMAQSAGDYQSVVGTELEWQDNTTWLTWNDILLTWEPASDYPTSGGTDITYTVTIQSGSEVVYGLNDPIDINIAGTGQLIVESGGILSVLLSQLNIESGAMVSVDGELNCTEDITNSGDLTVNGSLNNYIP